MNNIESICVFASSSNNIKEEYFKTAQELGVIIARYGYNIIYGGSNLGLMGAVINSACNYGAKITGVMPEKLYNLGIEKGNCTEFILTKGMRERKAKMDELSDAVIALAGGFGTLEELSEMIVQKQLGYNKKPIVILNTLNYYDKLIDFFNLLIKENFAPEKSNLIYFVAKTPLEAVEYIRNYKYSEIDYLTNKISKRK